MESCCPDVFQLGIFIPCLCKHCHPLTINNLESLISFVEDKDKNQIAEMKNIFKHITSLSFLNFSSREN